MLQERYSSIRGAHKGAVVEEFESFSLIEKRQLVERVAESELFRKAPRVRELFLYVADCTLQNRLEDVKEQVIAAKVFRRSPDAYDLQDSIVRAEARNLRRRLQLYFETEGKDEPVIIQMPKGGYALTFELREKPAPALPSQPKPPVRRYALLVAGYAFPLLVFLLAILRHGYPAASDENSSRKEKALLPFTAVFHQKTDTLLITSDMTALHILGILGRPIRLSDYVVRSYPKLAVNPPGLLDMWNRLDFTDSDEVSMATLILKRNQEFLEHSFLRSGHQVQLSDFREDNVILIGSPLSNPWAQLYQDQLNFYFDMDPQLGIVLRNRNPRSGELPEYPTLADRECNRSYADIALIPSDNIRGNALLIAGTTAAATVAAGELIVDPRFEQELEKLRINPKGPPRFFELLIRATTFANDATHSEIVAWRTRT